jgi:hypothetical protein
MRSNIRFKEVRSDPRMLEATLGLYRAGFRGELPSPWQLKVGAYNYFWTTGKITIDSGPKLEIKGIAAFIELLRAEKTKDSQASEHAASKLPTNKRVDVAGIGHVQKNTKDQLDPPF